MNMIKRCWAEVSIDNLLSNLRNIKTLIPDSTRIMCVVKANAYGHGDKIVVREMEKAGVDCFAVASADEAAHLRELGSNAEIVLLGACLDDCFPYAAEYDISLAVCEFDFARRLSEFASGIGKKIKVHIKLNTGMSRVGFDCLDAKQASAAASMIEEITQMPGLDIRGVFTHFSVSDECGGEEYTRFQLNNFNYVRSILKARDVTIPVWHCANSGAILNEPDTHMDMVRAGILLYGLYSGRGAKPCFKPALSIKTVITQIREIEKNTSVSYGRTYISADRRKTAVISIGYGDGYPRAVSGRGRMIVNGKFAAVLGRVCMDQTIIDVTGIDCKVGDIVTVVGTEGENEVTFDEIAQINNTINYEIICNISQRVPRIYYKNGVQTDIVKYL